MLGEQTSKGEGHRRAHTSARRSRWWRQADFDVLEELAPPRAAVHTVGGFSCSATFPRRPTSVPCWRVRQAAPVVHSGRSSAPVQVIPFEHQAFMEPATGLQRGVDRCARRVGHLLRCWLLPIALARISRAGTGLRRQRSLRRRSLHVDAGGRTRQPLRAGRQRRKARNHHAETQPAQPMRSAHHGRPAVWHADVDTRGSSTRPHELTIMGSGFRPAAACRLAPSGLRPSAAGSGSGPERASRPVTEARFEEFETDAFAQ